MRSRVTHAWLLVLAAAPLSADDSALRFEERFSSEIWPLLTRGAKSCLACHTDPDLTPLLLFENPSATFKAFLGGGHFEPESPTGILARVTSPDARVRMPPAPQTAWEEKDVVALRRFVNEVYALQADKREKALRSFPEALLEPWRPEKPGEAGPDDNLFLSYTQLRGKILALFGDAWQRGERDLFQENIAQFGGADFRRQFNESTKASATFLAALDRMAEDVAGRASLGRTGPFAGITARPVDPLPDPNAGAPFDAALEHLFRRVLFRSPSAEDRVRARALFESLERSSLEIAQQDHELSFELEVTGEEGLSTRREFSIPVERSSLALHVEWIAGGEGAEPKTDDANPKPIWRKVGEAFRLKAGDSKQSFFLLNRETSGAVVFHGIELRGPLDAPAATTASTANEPPAAAHKRITAGDREVERFGAWGLEDRGGAKLLSDGDQNKGESFLRVRLRVDTDGLYEVHVAFGAPGAGRKSGKGARRGPGHGADVVAVEVLSWNEQSHIGLGPPPAQPEKPGEAKFLMDQCVDSIAFQSLHSSFRFGSEGSVEVRNEGTTRRVVADAVQFEPAAVPSAANAAPAATLLIDNNEAEGKEGWKVFDPGAFRPYNVTGKDSLSDDNQKKGELFLRYRPSMKTEHRPDLYYRVGVGFPGKEGNETQAPVIVRAEASSPIVDLRVPYRTVVGAEATLDASASFDLQAGKLRYNWTQRSGPRAALREDGTGRATFTAPARDAHTEGWTALCRALLRHPDFLFTRPPSVDIVGDPVERRRLMLVKIAADLVGRAPAAEEVLQLDREGALEPAIDRYMASAEFRRFYFHRVRLYLESDGTSEGDEPARLWCHVAFHDRPFQEILTGDTSVNEAFEPVPRPAHHGKTGLLTMPGFLKGRPGLPHYNYAAHVAEKFLGYVFEVPPEIVAMREAITAISTTSPAGPCYSCHKVLTPLAHQRLRWDDEGRFLAKDRQGAEIDDSDRGLVPSYPYTGRGMEAFAAKAQNTERFIRTVIDTHFIWLFGREMRYQTDERALYKRLWDAAHESGFRLKPLLRALLLSPEYLSSSRDPRTRRL